MNKDNEKQQYRNRQEIRKRKAENKKRNKRKPIRLLPIWVRIIIVTIIFVVSLMAGLMFGYGVVGDEDPKEIIGKGPWLKMYDIIYKDE